MNETAKSRSEELKIIKDRCVAIIRFIRDIAPPSEMYSQMEEVTAEAYKRGDLRGLRVISRDILDWTKDLSSIHQRQLNEILILQFGDIPRDYSDDIGEILRRGKIEDEQEYRVLESRVDQIYADGSKKDELDKINNLLVKYQIDKR